MKATKTISFSHEYPKIHQQTEAVLIALYKAKKTKFTKEFLNYDTLYVENDIYKYYDLPKEDYIVLIFLGNFNIPFTTVRSFTEKKWEYYKAALREKFVINRE